MATTLVLERAQKGIKVPVRPTWTLGVIAGTEVVFLHPSKRVRVPVPTTASHLTLLVLGGIVGPDTPPGEYEVVALQRDDQGRVDGSVGFVIRIGKD